MPREISKNMLPLWERLSDICDSIDSLIEETCNERHAFSMIVFSNNSENATLMVTNTTNKAATIKAMEEWIQAQKQKHVVEPNLTQG